MTSRYEIESLFGDKVAVALLKLQDHEPRQAARVLRELALRVDEFAAHEERAKDQRELLK